MRFTVLLLMLVAAGPYGLAAAAAPIVRIDGHVAVDGPTIRLGDIAVIEGVGPELRLRLEQLQLGRAAAPARVRVLTALALAASLRRTDARIELDAPAEMSSTSPAVRPPSVRIPTRTDTL